MTSSALPRPSVFRRGALGQPGYARYLIAMLQGATGFWVAKIAQDWLLLRLTGDVSAIGVATALQFAPVLLFGLYGGVLADKFNVRGLLAGAQLLQGAGSVMIAVLAITGHIQAWHLFVAAAITGVSSVVEQPARSSMITQLSGRFVGQAISFNSLAFQLAGFWGPAVSALVVAGIGPGYAFAWNALGCTVTALLLFRAPTSPPVRTERERVSLRGGLATIRETTEIGWTMVLAALVSLLALSMPLVYAGMANQVFRTGIPGYSTFNSVAAIGCVIGSLIAARQHAKSRLRTLVGLLLVGAACLVASSFAPNPAVFAVITAVQCVVITLFQLLANALVQLSVEPSARGRVTGLYLLIVFGAMSIAGPIVGAVVDALGAPRTLQLLGGLLLLCTAASAVAIARFSGQKMRVERRRVVIAEPEVPRHVRLAMKDLDGVIGRTETTLRRSERERLLAVATIEATELPAVATSVAVAQLDGTRLAGAPHRHPGPVSATGESRVHPADRGPAGGPEPAPTSPWDAGADQRPRLAAARAHCPSKSPASSTASR